MSFHADDRWQRQVRDKMLVPFYERTVAKYIFLDSEEENSCACAVQKEIGVDTFVVTKKGVVQGVEEKIVRWPKDGRPHGAYALETDSCTLPGKEKDGWMVYSAADLLLYAFQQEDGSLLADLIPMQPLRKWFWEVVPSPWGGSMFPDAQKTKGETYPRHRMPTNNETEVRIVPIEDVWRAVEPPRRYHILTDGTVTRTEPVFLY